MAILIPNQPIIFDEVINPCHINSTVLTNKVIASDLTMFQFKLNVCGGEPQRLINASWGAGFDDWIVGGANWSTSGLGLSHVGNELGAFVRQDNVVIKGTFYEIIVTVDSFSGDGIMGVEFTEGGIFNGTVGTGATFTSAGVHKFYGFAQGDGIQITSFQETNAVISSIEARVVEHRYGFLLKDADGVHSEVLYFEDEVEEFLSDPPGPATNFRFKDDAPFQVFENFVTFKKEWLTTPNGLYQLCLMDGCANSCSQLFIKNGEFDDDNSLSFDWDLVPVGSATVDIQGGSLNYFGVIPSDRATVTQEDVLCDDIRYETTINVTTLDPGITLNVFIGGVLVPITSTGTTTFTEDIVSDQDLKISFGGVGDCVIEYIRFARFQDAVLTADECSNLIDLCDDDGCSLLIHGCNDDNSFGMAFGNAGFIPNVRVDARLVNATYEYLDIVKNDDSIGNRKVVYGERRKQKLLKIGTVPERLHDFLSLLLIFDHVLINNEEYVVDSEEYEVIYHERRENNGFIHLEVSEKTQLIKNVNCVESQEACFLPPLHLLLQDDDLVELQNGFGVRIGG